MDRQKAALVIVGVEQRTKVSSMSGAIEPGGRR
jgi:hypothetical protein